MCGAAWIIEPAELWVGACAGSNVALTPTTKPDSQDRGALETLRKGQLYNETRSRGPLPRKICATAGNYTSKEILECMLPGIQDRTVHTGSSPSLWLAMVLPTALALPLPMTPEAKALPEQYALP